MKRYCELNADEREKAKLASLNRIMKIVLEVGPSILGDHPAREAVEDAFEEAERMHTPWFAHEYIWEAVYELHGEKYNVSNFLEEWAKEEAELAFYTGPGEVVFHGVVSKEE